eukprot:6177110-Pleurochrysis_carterae.AAC.4
MRQKRFYIITESSPTPSQSAMECGRVQLRLIRVGGNQERVFVFEKASPIHLEQTALPSF